MNAERFDTNLLMAMRHSPVRNYVVPGLTSWLIGNPSLDGTMRLFENSRDHQEEITPHSHRFNFQCWVLRGQVRNRLWERRYRPSEGDLFRMTTLRYGGECGHYDREPSDEDLLWGYEDRVFNEGECYSMIHSEIHSIHFSRNALVLFFEGKMVSNTSVILEPVAFGEAIETMKVEPWMFKRESA